MNGVSGCLYAGAIAVVTAVMLVINGSVVLGLVRVLARSGNDLLARPDVAQILLFVLPVLMVAVEWKLLDLAGNLRSRAPSD